MSLHPQDNPSRDDDSMVARLRDVHKSYGSIRALRGIDLDLRRGEVLALLGPNGAGKTTAVSVLLGLLRADAGQVDVLGGHPRDAQIRARLGAMLQVSGVTGTLKVFEQIDLFRTYYAHPAPFDDLVETAGLHDILERRSDALSGGQRQRLLFALALAGDPELLFLDEPSAGMDLESRRRLWSSVRGVVGSGRTVLLTTHHLEEAAALADRVAVIDGGHLIAEGTPAELESKVCGRRIRCVSRLDPAEVSRLPDVSSVQRRGASLEILTPRAEDVLRLLFQLDPDLNGLEVGGAGLEQAFLALTQTAEDSPFETKERAA